MSNSPDLKAITKKFFAAYDAHDVDGMLSLCADGAQGRYLPYGKKSVMPIRGGLEHIWRGLRGAVPDFGVEVDEMIQAEGKSSSCRRCSAVPCRRMFLALSRKASPTASRTLTSFATTRPARSRAWIAIGTTPPSTPSRRAFCEEIPSKDGIGQPVEESGARRRAFEGRKSEDNPVIPWRLA